MADLEHQRRLSMHDPRDHEQDEPLSWVPEPPRGITIICLLAGATWATGAAIYQTCQSIAWLWRIIFGA